MDSEWVVVSVFLSGFVSGIWPLVNAELLVAGGVLAVPGPLRFPVVVACSLGQMASKTALYAGARWLPQYLPARARASVRRATARWAPGASTETLMLFSSASVGLPPFYLVSLASGVLGTSILRFVSIGLLGRTLRFAFVAAAALGAGEAWRGAFG